MSAVVKNTFGGLSSQYYVRQLFFSLVFLTFFMLTLDGVSYRLPMGMLAVVGVNTFLYPYSRYAYESIVGVIVGQNVSYANTTFALLVKLITMGVCWGFAIFIAPIELAYLYYRNSKI